MYHLNHRWWNCENFVFLVIPGLGIALNKLHFLLDRLIVSSLSFSMKKFVWLIADCRSSDVREHTRARVPSFLLYFRGIVLLESIKVNWKYMWIHKKYNRHQKYILSSFMVSEEIDAPKDTYNYKNEDKYSSW